MKQLSLSVLIFCLILSTHALLHPSPKNVSAANSSNHTSVKHHNKHVAMNHTHARNHTHATNSTTNGTTVHKITDPKIVEKNIHWLSVRLVSKLLKKLGDKRALDAIETELIKNCPNQDVIEQIRDEVINFKITVASIGNDKQIKETVSIGNWKNILDKVTNSCLVVIQKSEGYGLILKAIKNLQNNTNNKFQKIQKVAETSLHRIAIFLKVPQSLIDKKLAEIKEILRKEAAKEAAKKKAAAKAKADAVNKAKKTKADAEARKRQKSGNKKRGVISKPLKTKGDLAKDKAVYNENLKKEKKAELKKTTAHEKLKKEKEAEVKKRTADTKAAAPAAVVVTPLNKDLPANTAKETKLVNDTKITKMKNMTLASIFAKVIKTFAKLE